MAPKKNQTATCASCGDVFTQTDAEPTLCETCEATAFDAWLEKELADREAQADGDWLREWQTDHELGLV